MFTETGGPIKPPLDFTCITEPIINCIRRVNVYGGGKTIFSQSNFNYHNYLNKMQYDQDFLESTYGEMTGNPKF